MFTAESYDAFTLIGFVRTLEGLFFSSIFSHFSPKTT